MIQININTLPADVVSFVKRAGNEAAGVEVVENGAVLCKVVPPDAQVISASDQPARKADLMQLINRIRARTEHIPAAEAKRMVSESIEEVRRRDRK